MLVDTHCHLNFNVFDHDYRKVIDQTIKQDIWMVIIGTNFKNSVKAAQIASYYNKGVYATIGLHPIHIEKQKVVEGNSEFTTIGENFKAEKYKELADDSFNASKLTKSFIKDKKCCGRVVAIGETGLDYHYIKSSDINERKKIINRQVRVFKEHLKLANNLQLPVIIHARGAADNTYTVYDDLISILASQDVSSHIFIRGIVHAFYGNLVQAERLVNMGFLLGINAQILADKDLQNVIKAIDMKHIVLETDAPYFDPAIGKGRRNEPENVQVVSEHLAKLKNLSIYEINHQSTQNALRVFNIMG